MEKSVLESGCELVTLALKRHTTHEKDNILSRLKHPRLNLLPNTSGARNAEEAVLATRLSAESMHTKFIKLEIHPDPKYLLPDAEETLEATKVLAREGFFVMPYIHADPVLCKKLEDAGASAVMPLGAPIGTNKGLKTIDFLEIIIEQSNVPVVVDAGIGAPSHASYAMEIGADAVLVNTAIAVSGNPVEMSRAFKLAVKAGRLAYLSKFGSMSRYAVNTSPLTDFLQ
ncbi:thiazole synthase [Elysia marginata]|uniref:thiazole synthase n=1 Tax=Elysia marginata TaxID=1093978 RepID=A0AAV4F2P5_9GAST|nr:thiazole synthase [Elysia marginata]